MTPVRILLALTAAAIALATACGIDDLLIGAPCDEADDCPNLSCVRTASEEAAGEPGRCSEDGACVPGEQEGCVADGDGACDVLDSLLPVAGPQGDRYCCPSGTNPTVIEVAEDGTAECFDCPACSAFDGEEPCRAGEDRCVVEGDAPCGCRRAESALLDDPCGDDDDCGALACVRTLEQQAEPEEPQIPDQAQVDGQCRPSEDPTCAPGQSGCLLPPGAACSANNAATGVEGSALEYCCPNASDSFDFVRRVYAISEDQGEAACTVCANAACPDAMGNPRFAECTPFSDPACVVAAGELCGCAPPQE